MIIDAQQLFSDAQAITADAVGTNVIDLGVARSIGAGEPLAVLFVIDVAADQSSSDEDYEFEVEYASNAAQSAGREQIGSRIFESGTPTAPAADADLLVAGFQFNIPVPAVGVDEDERYIGIRVDVTGSTPTVTFTAALMPFSMIESPRKLYADGFTIS